MNKTKNKYLYCCNYFCTKLNVIKFQLKGFISTVDSSGHFDYSYSYLLSKYWVFGCWKSDIVVLSFYFQTLQKLALHTVHRVRVHKGHEIGESTKYTLKKAKSDAVSCVSRYFSILKKNTFFPVTPTNTKEASYNPQPKTKTKQNIDCFEKFCDSIFTAAHKEMWITRCNDWHRCVNESCLALDVKFD